MKNPSIVIIGAGMTGLLMSIKLESAGFNNVTLIEKKDRVGGTWRENTYPGVACDIPGHLYSYSFELNPNFSNLYPKGAELQEYFTSICEKYKVAENISFNEEVIEARYDENTKKWHLKTSLNRSISCDMLIAATGILHHPYKPEFSGSADFKGNIFHTAEWDHQVELNNTKIGFIGTGATACQAIPELVNEGAEVSVFQRTPQWILPMPDINYSDGFKSVQRRFPFLMKIIRKTQEFLLQHLITKAIAGFKFQHKLLSWLCRRNLKTSIKDSRLRNQLTPDYKIGCKRVVVNSTFYSAIQDDATQLITSTIEKFTPTGTQTTDGVHHPLDTIVLGTGFDAHRFIRPMKLIGREGMDIEDVWQNRVHTYLSLLIPRFPNFFLMLGPNAPISNYSVTTISEVQSDYILKLLALWQEDKLSAIEPTELAIEQFNQMLKSGFKGSNWTSGCHSWYLNPEGEPIVWPFTWRKWVKLMKTPSIGDFIVDPDSPHNKHNSLSVSNH